MTVAGLFSALQQQPSDPLLALIVAYRNDPRPHKIDLGVGVYRDETGVTPVMRAVKEAERRLLDQQATKSYVGPEGDVGFFRALIPVVFGEGYDDSRLCGLQTTGGTGALRLAAELIGVARPGARIHVGAPTWANHLPVLAAGGLEIVDHPYFDVATQTILFDEMLEALLRAAPGDVVLLHGACHNPTGADLNLAQWAVLAEVVEERGLVPFIDLAYQGLGDGLDEDAAGARLMLASANEALLAYSCDKNFALYRERTGALFALSGDAKAAAVTQSNLLALARANWSMPPDHGAAAARIVLEDASLRRDWKAELDGMRERIVEMRGLLAASHPFLAPVAGQKGLFSTLPLDPDQVRRMRDDHAIYMTGSGRINVAGLTADIIAPVAAAIAAVTQTEDAECLLP